MSKTIIEVKELRKDFYVGDITVHALKGVNMVIKQGEFVAIMGASGSGNVPSFTTTNSGTTPITATISVIPTVNSCVGTPSIYTITVNPISTVTVPANISVCNNGFVDSTYFVSTPEGGSAFFWTGSAWEDFPKTSLPLCETTSWDSSFSRTIFCRVLLRSKTLNYRYFTTPG